MSEDNIKTYTIRTDEPDVTAQVLAAAPDLLRAAKEAQLVLLACPACGHTDKRQERWEAVQMLQKAIDKAAIGASK